MGRDVTQFKTEGTGTMLAIQNGLTPASLFVVPMEEAVMRGLPDFIPGRCFYQMGKFHKRPT